MGSTTASAQASRRQQRRGSHFTDKQIAQSVKDGRAVHVTLLDGRTVLGWVYGMDDFHWGLVTLDGSKVLVHKSAPFVEFTVHLLAQQTSAVQALIEPVVTPFRAHVVETVFSKSNPATA